ncbi:MAG: macro domain-containing protein [Christensenella sp.]
MPLSFVHGDITKRKADAIVNAANTALQRGGGVCGAIFAAAGERELSDACARIGSCAVGEAVATAGFRLPARYIIHTAGPVWRGGNFGEEAMLRACYRNVLQLTKTLALKSVAFPLISSGIYGYPREQAYAVAVSEIGLFLEKEEMEVFLVLYP